MDFWLRSIVGHDALEDLRALRKDSFQCLQEKTLFVVEGNHDRDVHAVCAPKASFVVWVWREKADRQRGHSALFLANVRKLA